MFTHDVVSVMAVIFFNSLDMKLKFRLDSDSCNQQLKFT